MTTNPGFSSRSTTQHLTQLPQRDEAAMPELEPGFSNSGATAEEPAESTEAKVVDEDTTEAKVVTAAKTTSKRKS